MIKVLPEPVMPRSVWNLFPLFIPESKDSIAFGWSPFGV